MTESLQQSPAPQPYTLALFIPSDIETAPVDHAFSAPFPHFVGVDSNQRRTLVLDQRRQVTLTVRLLDARTDGLVTEDVFPGGQVPFTLSIVDAHTRQPITAHHVQTQHKTLFRPPADRNLSRLMKDGCITWSFFLNFTSRRSARSDHKVEHFRFCIRSHALALAHASALVVHSPPFIVRARPRKHTKR
jgi:hypothetical protein